MFSVARLYSTCILPDGNDYTFWGRGVSQGHSDAIRRIPGVVDARSIRFLLRLLLKQFVQEKIQLFQLAKSIRANALLWQSRVQI